MIKRRVKKLLLENDPSQPWNAFIDLIAIEEYKDLTDIQRIAHLCFWYDSEVQNGGHLQYFENMGTELVNNTISALNKLGAIGQSKVLELATKQYISKYRQKIVATQDYVDEALEGEFDEFDNEYYEYNPSISDLLEKYLTTNLNYFIEIED